MSDANRVCPTCAHQNRPGVLICENCGTNLLTGQQAAVGTRDLRGDGASADEEVGHWDVQKALKPEQSHVLGDGMRLRLQIEGTDMAIVMQPEQHDVIFGRHDPTTGTTPEIDLTRYAGYRMGVSRHHAAIRLSEDKELNVWDLGSHNGTFLNGVRLAPHRPYVVHNGDKLSLGQLVLQVIFERQEA